MVGRLLLCRVMAKNQTLWHSCPILLGRNKQKNGVWVTQSTKPNMVAAWTAQLSKCFASSENWSQRCRVPRPTRFRHLKQQGRSHHKWIGSVHDAMYVQRKPLLLRKIESSRRNKPHGTTSTLVVPHYIPCQLPICGVDQQQHASLSRVHVDGRQGHFALAQGSTLGRIFPGGKQTTTPTGHVYTLASRRHGISIIDDYYRRCSNHLRPRFHRCFLRLPRYFPRSLLPRLVETWWYQEKK